MFRRVSILVVLVLLLVGLNGAILAQTREFDYRVDTERWASVINGSGSENSFGFGQRIAGAWLGQGWFALDLNCNGVPDFEENPQAPPPVPFDYDSQSFSASGLYIATNPANPNLGHGTWKKTGVYEITTNNITYLNVPWPVDLVAGTAYGFEPL